MEIKQVRAMSYIRGVILSFMLFITRISLFVTILTYVLFDNNIDAKKVFVVTAFYNLLRLTMTMFFPQGIAQISEANVSINRLNQFLLYDETVLLSENSKEEVSNGLVNNYSVSIENGTAKWLESLTENTFTNININIKPGSLVAIIGPVGSGKTSLLHAMLKELPLLAGHLNVNGKISYASQEPWLFTSSVRQNILFGQEMDRPRYRTVINKCALQRDFNILPYADKTIVGERGVSLSGGQRARINLARAVYKSADIYLLDDPLSAVDTHVGKQLFEECIKGYLKEKTVILVTHQLQFLKYVDHIIILENGLIKAEGNYDELQASGLNFAKLLEHETEQVHEKITRQTSRTSVVSTGSVEGENPQVVEESKSSGTVSSYVYKAYVTAGANWCAVIVVLMLFMLSQICGSLGDYFITYW